MFTKNIFFRQTSSVSTRLNLLNLLVLLSGLLSIVGVYEIQLGAQLHKLNYQHQKYIDQVYKAVDQFEQTSGNIEPVKDYVILVREQPIECLNMVSAFEKFMMKIIGTGEAIALCEQDKLLADDILDELDQYSRGEISKEVVVSKLKVGLEGLSSHGAQFQPFVAKTVSTMYIIVISMVITKAIIVPFLGVILSSSVSRDYRTLNNTKKQLINEQERNELIQNERMNALSTMVAGVAHEINTPVGVSVTAASHARERLMQTEEAYQNELLSEEDLQSYFVDSKEAFRIIQNNLRRTSELVKSFKQVSVDQTEDIVRTFSAKEYLKDIIISLKPIVKKPSVEVVLDDVEDIYIETYPGVLSQIITNLITNSLSHAFAANDGGVINIALSPLSNKKVQIVFSDNGCGISKENLRHIFDPFFTTKRGQGGTGLGLHILHNLVVDKLDGEINCFSAEGEGTRFVINFPCVNHSAEEQFI
ncbi:HAMP domain-containing histidine kinase [Kordiimonas sp. SCSIO 12603]|uniref:sensor histidine kinase n=1 Tax=Kordiimonas sp. SCSIO 12603 TaxID=2829596 RepID=UPI002102E57D|nr:HAMP domain-containing sensor histidine kinase [Kordiimonas sp. SCSIO 12603]UTW59917.1 HAMP domain-containing histidine kinase [Kordiimonas sp. SCSIO 12603]